MKGITRVVKYLWKLLSGKNAIPDRASELPLKASELPFKWKLSNNLQENIETLNTIFDHTPDLVIRKLQMKSGGKAALAYLDGLADKTAINEHVLRPLLIELENLKQIEDLNLTIGKLQTIQSWGEVENALFEGKSILFIQGSTSGLELYTQGWPQRSIKEPQIESSLKGGHQGFVETAGQNIALIRRYIPDRSLKIQELSIGIRGKTKVSLMYLDDVINFEYVREAITRLNNIQVDAILNSGELAEFIEDHPMSPFPQIAATERPDSVASHILQGRIALVVDHSPSVLIFPVTLVSFMQTVDDYSNRWIVSSALRLLRYFAFFLTITLSPIYISIISFHYELLPVDLLISIGESRNKVPFPPIVEAILMEMSLEMLREAGLRLPSPIGQTIGVVGGIVIGQAAVQAGIVSNIMVIIVALSAISSFIMPDFDMSATVRLIKFPMMIMASLLGLFGVIIGIMIIAILVMSMESFGVPYSAPIIPAKFQDWKDAWIRFPIWKMNSRPNSLLPAQLQRQRTSREDRDNE